MHKIDSTRLYFLLPSHSGHMHQAKPTTLLPCGSPPISRFPASVDSFYRNSASTADADQQLRNLSNRRIRFRTAATAPILP